MTFTVEDALISPVSLAMLTGAGLNNVTDASNATSTYIYQPVQFDLPIVKGRAEGTACVHLDYDTAQDAHDIYFSENKGQIFGTVLDNAGAGVYFLSLATDGIKLIENGEVRKDDVTAEKDYVGECVPGDTDGGHVFTIPSSANSYLELTFVDAEQYIGCTLRVDCYCQRSSGARQITIDAENFAGDFYIEASTLFRDQYTKKDMPAVFVIPDAKIQSNFTFTMANSGDPSSFTFTMDAFPDYTKFDRTKKVFCAIQIMGDENVLPKDSLVKDDTCNPADPAITSAAPSVADLKGNYGRNLKTEITRKNIDFFGMLYPVSDTTEYLAKWNKLAGKTETVLPEGEATGYYFPVTLAGGTKYTYKSVAGTALASNDGQMLFAVDSTNPVVEVKVTGASDDKVSTYTFDFSKCVFK